MGESLDHLKRIQEQTCVTWHYLSANLLPNAYHPATKVWKIQCCSLILNYIIACTEAEAISKACFWYHLTLKGKSKNKPQGHNCKYQVIWPPAVSDTPTHRCWQLSGTCFWLALIPSCQLREKMHTKAFSSYSAEQLSYSILMDCECPTERLYKLIRKSLLYAKNSSQKKPGITSWVTNTR